MKKLNQEYWNNRYLQKNTPWDIGQPSTPLKNYLESLTDKKMRILIPGAGYAHEAIFLHKRGFKNVFICDWAAGALEAIQSQVPDFPKEHLICDDFFKLDLQVDLIIEQTFFCAIPRNLRLSYVKKAAQLLQNTSYSAGKIVGLLFAEEFEKEGPPFGGTHHEYQKAFSPYFNIIKLNPSYNSIAPRAGRELFVVFEKKVTT